jgi:GR25 family glycosyltransferase involved in LPS biosynthesis
LNKLGYDSENNRQGMHPIRRRIRAELNIANDLFLQLKPFFNSYHQSEFIKAFLHFSSFPKFRLQEKKWQSRVPKAKFLKYLPLIKLFYKAGEINQLFAINNHYYQKHIKSYSHKIAEDLNELSRFFKIKTPIVNIILAPNFLDAYWRGYGPMFKNKQYIVYGPCDNLKKYKFLIRHEFLHGLINPLRDKKIKKLFQSILPLIKINKQTPKFYPAKKIMAWEYLIRAFNILYLTKNSKKDLPNLLNKERRKGFKLIEKVIEQIKMP